MIYNRLLLIPFISWCGTQISKAIIYWIVNKKLSLERLYGDGGMPSGHSAVVASLATAIGLQCGWDSPVFALAVILAIIVMHDAAGVRQETGKQAKVINVLVQELRAGGRGELSAEETLKEFVGHTGLQVFVGALGGIVSAVILHMILP